jgi:hypothetical protein
MNVTIPIYVQARRDTYTVRPLFFPGPVRQHEKLERVLHLLARDLRKELYEIGRQLRHDDLAQWTFSPEMDYHRLELVLELRKRMARGESGPGDDPLPLLPVLRVYNEGGSTLDLRTGLVDYGTSLQRFLSATLPLPPELR